MQLHDKGLVSTQCILEEFEDSGYDDYIAFREKIEDRLG